MDNQHNEWNKQQEANRQAQSVSIAILKTNQENMDKNIKEIKTLVISFDTKLDLALDKKADKVTVDKIQGDIRWVTYTIIGFVILGILGTAFMK